MAPPSYRSARPSLSDPLERALLPRACLPPSESSRAGFPTCFTGRCSRSYCTQSLNFRPRAPKPLDSLNTSACRLLSKTGAAVACSSVGWMTSTMARQSFRSKFASASSSLRVLPLATPPPCTARLVWARCPSPARGPEPTALLRGTKLSSGSRWRRAP